MSDMADPMLGIQRVRRRLMEAEYEAFEETMEAYVHAHDVMPRAVWRAVGADGVTVFGAGNAWPRNSGVTTVWTIPPEVPE